MSAPSRWLFAFGVVKYATLGLLLSCSKEEGSSNQAVVTDAELLKELPETIGAHVAPLYQKMANGTFQFTCSATLLPQVDGLNQYLGLTSKHCINRESSNSYWLRVDPSESAIKKETVESSAEEQKDSPSSEIKVLGNYLNHDVVLFSYSPPRNARHIHKFAVWSDDLPGSSKVAYLGGYGASNALQKSADGYRKGWFEGKLSEVITTGGCQHEMLMTSVGKSSGSSSCDGDSGGPVIQVHNERLEIVGLILGGNGGSCQNGMTRVLPIAGLRGWAVAQAQRNGIEIEVRKEKKELKAKDDPGAECKKDDNRYNESELQRIAIANVNSALPTVNKALNNALATGRLNDNCSFVAVSKDGGRTVLGITAGHCAKSLRSSCKIQFYKDEKATTLSSDNTCKFKDINRAQDLAYLSFGAIKPKTFATIGSIGTQHYSIATFTGNPADPIETVPEFNEKSKDFIGSAGVTFSGVVQEGRGVFGPRTLEVKKDGFHGVSAVKSWSGAGIFNSNTGALVCVHSDGNTSSGYNKCVILE